MIGFRRVSGDSMQPTLSDGHVIIVFPSKSPAIGDVVVAYCDGKELIKRVIKVQSGTYWVEGDSPERSTDSRHFGWIDKSDILGVMKISFPVAIEPPKPRKRHGILFGWVAAIIMIGFALVHLFRIDTFVPELNLVFQNSTLTMWVASLLVIMEVFAIPFLLRIRMSRLAQYVSGAFAIVVPLIWTLITIWTFGSDVSTAQLGEFVNLQSGWILLVANIIWLKFSYYTVWALGYDRRVGEKDSIVYRYLSRLSK